MLALAVVALVATACRPMPIGPRDPVGTNCGDIEWGSLASVLPGTSAGPVTDLRAGRHPCFDRLVVDIGDDAPPGWNVGYVDRVRAPGSGFRVPLRGAAELRVIVRSPAYTPVRQPTYDPADPDEALDVSGFDTFRQVAFAGSFEAQSVIGLGVRARLPFRVFTLDGTPGRSRLVIDVAHRWY